MTHLSKKQQHNLALAMLCATAIVWGFGFLINNRLLELGFADLPFTVNAIRFSLAALVMLAFFCRSIKFDKDLIIYGALGGLFLFGGFGFQLVGLKYTTPASSGFFTAAYTLFVPFIAWAVNKRRPSAVMIIGMLVAFGGLIVLNIPNGTQTGENELLGNLLTLACSLFFAAQIVLTDNALNTKKLSSLDMSTVQICACALLFIISSLIFESGKYASAQIDWAQCSWRFAIVSIFGTAFAYFAQTYGQSHLSPTEASVILACESPLSAIFSCAFGVEPFSWQILVGGILIFGSVLMMEVLQPFFDRKKQAKFDCTNESEAEAVNHKQDG